MRAQTTGPKRAKVRLVSSRTHLGKILDLLHAARVQPPAGGEISGSAALPFDSLGPRGQPRPGVAEDPVPLPPRLCHSPGDCVRDTAVDGCSNVVRLWVISRPVSDNPPVAALFGSTLRYIRSSPLLNESLRREERSIESSPQPSTTTQHVQPSKSTREQRAADATTPTENKRKRLSKESKHLRHSQLV